MTPPTPPPPPHLLVPLWLLRALIALNLALGLYYLSWRYGSSINWAAWPIALALLAAETYSYIDTWLFGLTMWRLKRRGEPDAPPEGATVDVFITCYNEPVELVRETAIAARDMRWPHQTYILDDGNSPAMHAMAEEIGVGYITRAPEWQEKARHAKAGNLNNALFRTNGEYLLILDADQIPFPQLLERTLGYFRDPKVSFVQTPQWFYNVPPGDPFGSRATLFYGPIQQGKDGWNAAFFCGSNAVLRREALMQIGVRRYVYELGPRVGRALKAADHLLQDAERQLREDRAVAGGSQPRGGGIRAAVGRAGRQVTSSATHDPGRDTLAGRDDVARRPEDDPTFGALRVLREIVAEARRELQSETPIQDVTWEFQRRVELVSRVLVTEDLERIRAELADIPGIDVEDLEGSLSQVLDDEAALRALTGRSTSPLTSIETVRNLLMAVDVDREDEAQPLMPMSTISVTEDMATAMRLHASGWRSVYHDEVLARGLAPEDLRTSLQQRLRWAQGTIQVMLRENPLIVRGLSLGQRLMYFATMYSYLSGFVTIIYLTAPLLYLFFGILPVQSLSTAFFLHLLPYLLVNQLLFIVTGWGRSTWRGQQYSLALFPLWIQAVVTAVANVYFGGKLGFVVTPKERPSGVQWMANLRLVRTQVTAMLLLFLGAVYGLQRLALGQLGSTSDEVAMLVNVGWVAYDLLLLSVVIKAATYRPDERTTQGDEVASTVTSADLRGRAGAGNT